MTPSSASGAAILSFNGRLGPAPSFLEASARVDEALDALRKAEASLERQLAELRSYIRDESVGGAALESARAA